ncbi:MAG: magnesium and cobalt transport protein CorA [Gordonia sp. (in: high G+C Gram-positive bacteria)]|uniref:magnesium and cobalt transport protein CorA n=1 Tax=Gordonia sp. (in: high G+C Gram-positive bacteria) TaxID=84139 RepID=UPI0039E4F375
MPSLHWGPSGGDRRADPPLPPIPANRAVVDCGVYVDGVRQPGLRDFANAYRHVRETGEGFVWLGLHSPNEKQMTTVAEVFGLHHLIVEDLVSAHQRPKLELYDDIVFLVLRSIHYIDHDSLDRANDIVDAGEIMLISGRDFVITVRHGDHTQLAGVRAALEARPEILRHGPAIVVHGVADRVVDSYVDVVDQMQPDIDELEERIFAASTAELDIDVVYLSQREVLELRRAVLPLAPPLAWLSGNERPPVARHLELDAGHLTELIGGHREAEIRRHFRDVADHLSTVIDMVNEYDNRLGSLLQAAATKVSIQQSTDMRKISAWAALAAVPTMIAGIYGMNFEFMPELKWEFSYPVVLLVMIGVCALLWRSLHRNKWL